MSTEIKSASLNFIERWLSGTMSEREFWWLVEKRLEELMG